jgi:hypothetical protein
MKILEKEMQLREETRTLEQAKAALEADKYEPRAERLSTDQQTLAETTADVVKRIIEQPDGETAFAKEIAMLSRVVSVMGEAAEILGQPDTGPDAIAAETEAIELLLQTKRQQPGSGSGGGGSTPGGNNSKSKTAGSALADIGPGSEKNAQSVKREVQQATGIAGRHLPDEFRHGLDAYFNLLEGGSSGGD